LRRAAAVFVIHAGVVLTADRLVDLIWERKPPANPEAALHTVISRLRGRLVTAGLVDRLLTRPPGYLLRLSPGDYDAQLFADLVDRATDRLAVDPVGADDQAAAAPGLWRGPAYAELADLEVAAQLRRLVVVIMSLAGAGERFKGDLPVLMDLDPARAATLLDRAVADARQLGDRFLTGVALLSLASVTARHEDPGRAVPLFAEVIEHWHRLGNWTQRWTTFRTVAEVLARVGDPENAAVLLGACQRKTAPAPAYRPDARRLDELADRLRTRLGGAQVDRPARQGGELTADEVVTLVRGALDRAADRSA